MNNLPINPEDEILQEVRDLKKVMKWIRVFMFIVAVAIALLILVVLLALQLIK